MPDSAGSAGPGPESRDICAIMFSFSRRVKFSRECVCTTRYEHTGAISRTGRRQASVHVAILRDFARHPLFPEPLGSATGFRPPRCRLLRRGPGGTMRYPFGLYIPSGGAQRTARRLNRGVRVVGSRCRPFGLPRGWPAQHDGPSAPIREEQKCPKALSRDASS